MVESIIIKIKKLIEDMESKVGKPDTIKMGTKSYKQLRQAFFDNIDGREFKYFHGLKIKIDKRIPPDKIYIFNSKYWRVEE